MRRLYESRCLTHLLFTLALCVAIQPAVSQTPTAHIKPLSPRVQEQVFHSKSLNRDMHYLIVLPVGYEQSQQRYPVLYLLHGWAGDYKNWVTLTNLVQYSSRYAMIIVTPDAQNSWYVNSATVPQDRFEDYMIQDLIPAIDTRWRTISSPNRRSIAGLSMGGYGAVLFGLKHSDLFAVVGSDSGAFEAPSGVEQVMPVLRESTDRAFGPGASLTRNDNNLHLLLAKTDRIKTPYFFVECGAQDPFLPSNRNIVQEISSAKIAYEYHEYPGAHDWEFWDHSLPMMLEVIASRIIPGKSPVSASRPKPSSEQKP
jgi:putative tributyrin esterase